MEFQEIILSSKQYQEAASWLAQVDIDHLHFMGNTLFPQVDRAIGESQTVSIRINRQNQPEVLSDVPRFTIESIDFYSAPSSTTPEIEQVNQSWEEVDVIRYGISLKPKIEQAQDSTSSYREFLEAAGWTDLQDVELCSGRETWGCPPGGVCPRKVVHEDIKPAFKEQFANKLGVTAEFLEQVLSRALPGDIIEEEDN